VDQPGYFPILNMRSSSGIARTLALLAVVAYSPLPAQQSDGSSARLQSDSAPEARVRSSAPDTNQARGVDAELRLALFDLASDRPLTALNRLEWLRSSPAASALSDTVAIVGGARASAGFPGASTRLRSRADLLFLLAESYHQLGMVDAFGKVAAAVAAAPGGGRYAGIINSQLMLDAYRRGDHSRVLELARSSGVGDGGARTAPPLARLLSGLAAYQTGDFASARAAFATVRSEGGVYAPYAQLMDALALMQGDTTRALEALGALRPLGQVATGAFGDHVRLIAAELSYESGQYEAAVASAHGVGAETGLGAQALFTEGWALYRAGRLDAARVAFANFAARYPLLPERDEARLMAGQVMLESGRAAEAEVYFQAMADSVAAESASLNSRSASTLSDGARALVAARAAGIAFVDYPRDGKTLALAEGAGAELPAVLAAFAGGPAPTPRTGPHIVSVADIAARLRAVEPRLGAGFPRRILFLPPGTPASRSYAGRAQALADADVLVALANHRVHEQLDANVMKIAALEELRALIASSKDALEADARTIALTRDSLSRMRSVLAQGRDRAKRAVLARIAETRRMAADNRSVIDSMRAAFTASGESYDAPLLEMELETATTYGNLAALVEDGLDTVIERHPVFALADSLGKRLGSAESLLADARSVLAADSVVATGSLAALRGRESGRTLAARDSLAMAESRRAVAEGQLVALLDADLRARALALATRLQHDQEAAEYGSANAAFFRAIEPDNAAGTAPRTGGGEP
jgi:hypothetical protein